MLKAIIMDFDGLILDTEVAIYEVYKDWFKAHRSYDLTLKEFSVCVGSDVPDLLTLLETKGVFVDENCFRKDVGGKIKEKIKNLPPRDGVPQFIQNVKSEGLKLALATSSGIQKPKFHLTRLGLIDKFDVLTTADDVEKIKPHPDLFLKALERLEIHADEALVVEDSYNGFLAGSRAGLRVMVAPNDATVFGDFFVCYKQVASLADFDVKLLVQHF